MNTDILTAALYESIIFLSRNLLPNQCSYTVFLPALTELKPEDNTIINLIHCHYYHCLTCSNLLYMLKILLNPEGIYYNSLFAFPAQSSKIKLT